MQVAASGATSGPRTLLAVGSGKSPLPEWETRYTIVRLDIDPRMEPDIVASMTDMGPIGPYDALLCSHALEHLYPHEVPRALAEFYRVLKPGGLAIVLVPDLEGVAPTEERLPGTELNGLHLFYGDASMIEEFPHMAHHCGFVAHTLAEVMTAAGFRVKTDRASHYNLVAVGVKD
jgi:protein O-GlcNAc transferase